MGVDVDVGATVGVEVGHKVVSVIVSSMNDDSDTAFNSLGVSLDSESVITGIIPGNRDPIPTILLSKKKGREAT